jgi:hypothetical protein
MSKNDINASDSASMDAILAKCNSQIFSLSDDDHGIISRNMKKFK